MEFFDKSGTALLPLVKRTRVGWASRPSTVAEWIKQNQTVINTALQVAAGVEASADRGQDARATLAGDAVFQVGLEHPDWFNGFEHEERGGGPRARRSPAGAGGQPRVAGGHAPVVPVRLPRGDRRRRVSLGAGAVGVLTASWVTANKASV
jgi:hypothetical protein